MKAKKKERASSIDVAALAGVSQSAVSRAFTPGAVVSEKTRAKVLAAAARLNYRPNALARSLITKRSNMVALVIGDIENPFYAKIVNVFSLRMQARGLHVLLFSLAGDGKVEAALNEVLKYRVDGVMLVSAVLSQEMADGCRRLGTPVVLYNRYAKSNAVSSVRVENYEGGRRVADFLVGAGHERIAYVGGTRPDAIFAVSDLMALGVLEAARREFDLRVPEELSVIGFDDIPMSSWPSYELTTVRQPVQKMVDEALNLLLAQMEDPDAKPVTRLIPGELIVRRTARPPT